MSEGPVPSEGALDATTVREVLTSLAASGRTGLLRVHGGDERLVALADGELYLATTASGPSLHQVIVGSGAAPEVAWAEATAAGDDIAARLDADHRVDSERLSAVLEEHLIANMVELLAPGTERYEFLADRTHQLGAHHRFGVTHVLAEAARRLDTWRSSSAHLGSTATEVVRAPTLPPGSSVLSVTAVEWQVLTALPERSSIAEVIARSGLSAFTVFDVLNRLVIRRLVLVADDPAEAGTGG